MTEKIPGTEKRRPDFPGLAGLLLGLTVSAATGAALLWGISLQSILTGLLFLLALCLKLQSRQAA